MKPRPVSIPESKQFMAAVPAAFFCAFSSSVFHAEFRCIYFFAHRFLRGSLRCHDATIVRRHTDDTAFHMSRLNRTVGDTIIRLRYALHPPLHHSGNRA